MKWYWWNSNKFWEDMMEDSEDHKVSHWKLSRLDRLQSDKRALESNKKQIEDELQQIEIEILPLHKIDNV